jgi:hypothetical protein
MLYTIILREKSTRKIELTNLYNVFFLDEGSEYLSLVLRTNVGKIISLTLKRNLRI